MKKMKRRTKSRPNLRFSPYAWAKLLFLRDRGPTEIGGFGIATERDPLLIEDIAIVKQQCTAIHVQFDDDAVADFFDQQIDLGRKPETFARVWIHTHPGNSAQPSLTDEKTFRRVFGKCDWAVMAILARGGETTARLRFNAGPGGALPIPAKVAFESPFPASNQLLWSQDYQSKIQTRDPYHGICLPGESEDCVHRMNEGSIFRDANEADLWEAAFW